MISGALEAEEFCKTFSLGRVSRYYAKHLSYNCGVMDGRIEERSPVRIGLDGSDCKFREAVETAAE